MGKEADKKGGGVMAEEEREKGKGEGREEAVRRCAD